MAESESDIEIKSKLIKKNVKMPQSPSEYIKKTDKTKKITTKTMIINALKELKSRRGTSLYAVKKYLEEEYNVDPDKIKYLIKKTIKSGIDDGSIIQVKGIGASGSFKLAKEEKKVKKPQNIPNKITKDTQKVKKSKKIVEKSEEIMEKPEKPKSKKKNQSEPSKEKVATYKNTGVEKLKKSRSQDKNVQEKRKKLKKAILQTPAKKRSAMMRRKNIRTIIKTPKMKPKHI